MVEMATCDVNFLKGALGIQQTGPRTVIVPADPIEWSNSKSYEYLTIVTSADFGQAYISKKDVPSGTPLTNTEYWIPAATFNAQLAEIMRQLAGKADTSAVTALQQSLNNEVTRAKVAEQANATAIAKETARAKAAEAALDKQTVIVIGDSISRYAYDSDSDTVLNTGAELWENVHDKTGYSISNYSAGGAGFIVGATPFLSQLSSAVEDFDSVDDVRCVVVYGGTNDISAAGTTTNSFQDAVRAFMNAYAESKFAKVPLFIVFNKGGMTTYTGNMINAAMLAGQVGTLGKSSPITLINATGLLAGYGYTGSDNVHPNNNGYNWLAGYMAHLARYGCPPDTSRQALVTIGSWSGASIQINRAAIEGNTVKIIFTVSLTTSVVPVSTPQILVTATRCGSCEGKIAGTSVDMAADRHIIYSSPQSKAFITAGSIEPYTSQRGNDLVIGVTTTADFAISNNMSIVIVVEGNLS